MISQFLKKQLSKKHLSENAYDLEDQIGIIVFFFSFEGQIRIIVLVIRNNGELLSLFTENDIVVKEKYGITSTLLIAITFSSFFHFYYSFELNIFFGSICAVDSYLISSHTTDYQNPMLLFNTVAVLVLVIAKFPNMHKVRIFGINGDQ